MTHSRTPQLSSLDLEACHADMRLLPEPPPHAPQHVERFWRPLPDGSPKRPLVLFISRLGRVCHLDLKILEPQLLSVNELVDHPPKRELLEVLYGIAGIHVIFPRLRAWRALLRPAKQDHEAVDLDEELCKA